MLNLTLRQLQILDAVARCGSFSRASADLHVTQPAVSMQIKQLEEALGMPLYEHMGKKIALTRAGEKTLQTARAIHNQLSDLEQSLSEQQGLKGGSLTVSVTSTVNVFAARILAVFRSAHPDVKISLNVFNRETLLRHLVENNSDLALMGQPPSGYDLNATPFLDNPLVVISSRDHALAGNSKIKFEAFIEQPIIGREQGSGTRAALEAFLAEQGYTYSAAMEMNKNEAIKQAVEVGLGLGVVSLHTVQAELASGQLSVLDVEGFPLRRQWYLVSRRGKRASPAAKAFNQLVFEQAENLRLYDDKIMKGK